VSVLTTFYLYLCSERVNYFYLYLCSERVNYFYLYMCSERVNYLYLYMCSERVNYFYLYMCSERVNYFYLYLYSERVIIKLSFIHSEVCRLKPISDEEVGRTLDGLQGKVHRTRTFDECKLICIANNECKLVAYRTSVKGFVTCRTNYYKKRYIHHGVQYDLRQCEMTT